MKKRICLLIFAMAFLLSACGGSVNVNINAPDDSAKEADKDEVPEEVAEKTETAPESEPQTEQGEKPVYKVVSKYFSAMYEGNEKEDGEGNPLEGREVFDGLAQAIMVAEESKDAYPELYKTLNEDSITSLNAASSDADGVIAQAQEDASNSKKDNRPFIGPYSDYLRVSVRRADSKVLSYCTDYSGFTGGAHGMYGRSGYTYDVRTGKKLSITDVVKLTEDDLIPVLKEKLLALNDEDVYDDLDENLKNYKLDSETEYDDEAGGFTFGYKWYLDNDGMHFYFGPYEIAPYAAGDFDVVIAYDELPGDVNEEYLPDENAGYIVNCDIPMTGSTWDDKSDTSLHFVYETDESEEDYDNGYECTALTLKKGDKSATAEEEYFTYNYDKNFLKQYKVVTKDGKEYIYVCALSYNDYTDVMVFDINDNDIKLAGVFTCHLVYDTSDPDYYGEFIPTDPENMYFGQVGNLFGTYTCYGRHVVGDDGMPEPADSVYKISWGSEEAKSLKSINVTMLDDKYNEQGEETIDAGEHFLPIRTDNSSFVDCRLDDGRLVRLKITKTDYPVQIDGEDVDDLFEGLVYAG